MSQHHRASEAEKALTDLLALSWAISRDSHCSHLGADIRALIPADITERVMDLDIDYVPTLPKVDVQLSATFTMPAKFMPLVMQSILKALPLTASVELEFRDVTDLPDHTNGSAT
jgi:hypothetical protein